MLASITPLGERGRQSSWGVTVTAFALGAIGAGAAAGALLGEIGALVLPGGAGARLAVLLAALLAALLLDAAPRRVPGPHRQVNPRWLDEYRGWVYGVGYGAQLGLGITTVVTSAATYAALLAALLTGRPLWGAAVLGCYGAVRGLTPLSTARVRDSRQLLAVHARLERWRGRAGHGARAALAVASVAALAGCLG
jgi:MFS family permease